MAGNAYYPEAKSLLIAALSVLMILHVSSHALQLFRQQEQKDLACKQYPCCSRWTLGLLWL